MSANRAARVARQREVVLAAIADGALHREAAEAAGITRETVRRWRNTAPEFAAAYAEALEQGTDVLEDVLDQCAKKATSDPRYAHSLQFALMNRRPAVWKQRYGHEVRSRTSTDVSVDAAELDKLCEAVLARCAEISGSQPLAAPGA